LPLDVVDLYGTSVPDSDRIEETHMVWHTVTDAQRLCPRGVTGVPMSGRPVEKHYLYPGRWRG
jgi:hypothetical protein